MRLIRLLKRDLAAEISIWTDQGLISTDQARSICRLYGVDFDAIKGRSRAYGILAVLGMLFAGLSLITLVSANWETIPRGLRMFGLLALTMGTHGLAARVYLSGKKPLGIGLVLLGNVFYGASIVLISQIYHLGEHMPTGVFLWAIGSLPFAVLLCNSWLALFSGALALVWLFLDYGTGFVSVLFPVFVAAEIYVLARGRQSLTLFLTCVASIFLWIENVLAAVWLVDWYHDPPTEKLFVGVALFVLAYAVSHFLYTRESVKAKDYGVALSLWVMRFALFVLLVMSSDEIWLVLIESSWSNQKVMWAVLGLIAVVALVVGWKTGKMPVVFAVSVLCGGAMVAVVLTEQTDNAVYFQVIDNVALVVAGIILIKRGATGGVSHYFFLGVAVILLTAFLRYGDLIGGYIGGAALFMGFAVLLLGSAYYWRVRQRNAVPR